MEEPKQSNAMIIVKPKSNRGGARKGAGRKKKSHGEKVAGMTQAALIRIYGSMENFLDHLAAKSVDDKQALGICMNYAFGKPTEVLKVEPNKEEVIEEEQEFTRKEMKLFLSEFNKEF